MMDPFEIQFSDNLLSDQFLENHYALTADSLSPPNYEVPQLTCDVPGPFRSPKRRGRPVANNAARERSRVKTLRSAFLDLQRTLPAVPPDTKLSKLDVLVLATTYIAHLMSALHDGLDVSQIFAANGCMHPVKKWPMRTRLYAGILSSTGPQLNQPPGDSSNSKPEVEHFSWMSDSRRYR